MNYFLAIERDDALSAAILQFPAMSDLPNRIREHRLARGLTLEQVALQLNCSFVQVSDLERGRRQLTDNWMRRIAPVLGIEPADLLLERDNSMGLSPAENDLVLRYRSADPETQAKIRSMIELLAPPATAANDAKVA